MSSLKFVTLLISLNSNDKKSLESENCRGGRDRCWETPRCVIHNRYGVSDPCVSQNSCEISAPQLAHKLHSVMNCDARYASARSELALIEIFVNLGKMKSVLIRVRPICLPCARGQVRSD